MRYKQLTILLCVVLITLPSLANRRTPSGESYKTQPPKVRFVPLHIYLDPAGAALGAYQFELKILKGNVKIVGIEGSQHEAFKQAPYYDPLALTKQRIVIAAYTTDKNGPSKKLRIATVHLHITGEREPEFALDLEVAANSEGQALDATITLEQGDVQ